jgi:hypothetical protein
MIERTEFKDVIDHACLQSPNLFNSTCLISLLLVEKNTRTVFLLRRNTSIFQSRHGEPPFILE